MGVAELLKDQIKKSPQPAEKQEQSSVFGRLFAGSKAKTKAAQSPPPSGGLHNHTSDCHDYTAESRLKKSQALDNRRDSNSNIAGKKISSTASSSSTRRHSSDSALKSSPSKGSSTGLRDSKVPNSNSLIDSKNHATPKLSEYEKQIMSGKFFVQYITLLRHLSALYLISGDTIAQQVFYRQGKEIFCGRNSQTTY